MNNSPDNTNLSEVPIENSESYSASISLADVNLMEKGSASSRSMRSDTLVDVSEQSSSFAEDVDAVVTTSPRSSGSRKKRLCVMIPLVFVVVAVVIGLSVGLSSKSTGASSPTDNNLNPPVDVNPDSGLPISPRASYEDIVAWLLQENVSSEQALVTDGTPQNRAARWLAQDDKAGLPLPETSIGDDDYKSSSSSSAYMYMVRYVLTVLYYQMDGESWPTQVNFLTDKPVCQWQGISRKTNGYLTGSELGGLRCDKDTGLPVILDLGTWWGGVLCEKCCIYMWTYGANNAFFLYVLSRIQ